MINADSHASTAEDIARALDNELETLTQVVETLDIEHDALMGSDAQRLEQAVAAKQRAITTHAQARYEREMLGLREDLRAQIESHPGFFNGLQNQVLACIDDFNLPGAAEAAIGLVQKVWTSPNLALLSPTSGCSCCNVY